MKKRGQSAIEFLTTYGLFIVILAVILGLLLYMGVFDRKINPEVTIEEPVEISDFKITNTSVNFRMRITPEAKSGIITDITVKDISCNILDGELYNTNLSTMLTLSGCKNLTLKKGKKVGGEIFVTYESTTGLTRNIVGEYTGKVEGGEEECGNGILDQGEECDDGNLEEGDGCNQQCLYTHKECDGDACVNKLGQGNNLCSTSYECLIDCNNNNIQEDEEQCDGTDKPSCQEASGHTSGETICTHCRLDTSLCHTCGNEVVEGPEQCDFYSDNSINFGNYDGNCQSLGYPGGEFSCYQPSTPNECTYDLSNCEYCGDGRITGEEECDFDEQGNEIVPITCSDYFQSSYSGELHCNPVGSYKECEYNTAECINDECGNHILNFGEECDFDEQGNIIFALGQPQSCSDIIDANGDPLQEGEITCHPQFCFVDNSSCHTCGNQIAEGPEQCDTPDLAGTTCDDIQGFNGGVLSCYYPGIPDLECMFYTGSCTQSCGNGIHEPEEGEECDDGNLIAMDGCNYECKLTHNTCEQGTCVENLGAGISECIRNEVLISHLSFNTGGDSDGDTTPDSSPQNNYGIIYENQYGQLTHTSENCKYGNCYLFDRTAVSGSNGMIQLSDNFQTDGEFSVEAWIRFPQPPNPGSAQMSLFAINAWYTGVIFGFSYSDMRPFLIHANPYGYTQLGSSYFVTSNLQTGQDYHIAMTCGPDYGLSVYFNGVRQVASAYNSLASNAENCFKEGTNTFNIGGGPYGTFDGVVDNIIIYSRELSLEEVGEHYQNSYDSCQEYI